MSTRPDIPGMLHLEREARDRSTYNEYSYRIILLLLLLYVYWCVCDKSRSAQIHSKNPPEETKLNELYQKRRGTSQMSEQFGPNFVPGSFALQQSIRLVYTLRALSRGRNRATRATRDNQDAQTQKEHTHARQRRHNTTASPRLRRHRHQRRRCCFCCAAAAAAAVLLLMCCLAAAVLLLLSHTSTGTSSPCS